MRTIKEIVGETRKKWTKCNEESCDNKEECERANHFIETIWEPELTKLTATLTSLIQAAITELESRREILFCRHHANNSMAKSLCETCNLKIAHNAVLQESIEVLKGMMATPIIKDK